jgi:hypothetical protein
VKIPDLKTLSDSLAQLDPEADGFDLQADEIVMGLNSGLGEAVCQPFFEFFEAHPLSYAGAPGTFVHHIETYYPAYVPALTQSVTRRPSVNTILLVNRILNSSDCSPHTRDEFLQLLRVISTSHTCQSELVELASRFLHRHTQP